MFISSRIPMAMLVIFLSFSSVNAETSRQSTVIPADSLSWGYLNPLRGDKSPGAANIWGDRTRPGATGMLVRFNKDFSSPPHIHNISYRGVVINGLVHNDDPTAEFMWLPTASYWTQPAGENHITAANGESNLIYLEIDSGPYLVKPSKQKFDNGERPINIHASNLVWLNQMESSMLSGKRIEISFLWQSKSDDLTKGHLVKILDDTNVEIASDASDLKAVVIKGSINYKSTEVIEPRRLKPGSFFSSNGKFTHTIATSEQTILYVRSNKSFKASSDVKMN